MIKKGYRNLFTKQLHLDSMSGFWKKVRGKIGKRFSIITVDDLLVDETYPNNTLIELETKMGKSYHTFQQILSNSL